MYSSSRSKVDISYVYTVDGWSAQYDLFFEEYQSADPSKEPKEKSLTVRAMGKGKTREEAEKDVLEKLSEVTFGKDLTELTQEDIDSLKKFEDLDVKLLVSGY